MAKLLILLFVFNFFIFAKSVEAKVLPQAAKVAKQTGVKPGGSTIGVYPKLRSDRRALIINFTNLQKATAVSYVLTYDTYEQSEAATGALNLVGQSSEKVELLFGTCSKNVCRYHTGIKNSKLEVSYTSQSGKKYLKKFRIKV